MSWLDANELRVGLGCMRLPADEQLALDTILAAARGAMTVFDTAHAYGATRALPVTASVSWRAGCASPAASARHESSPRGA
jgi:hypothetical protein